MSFMYRGRLLYLPRFRGRRMSDTGSLWQCPLCGHVGWHNLATCISSERMQNSRPFVRAKGPAKSEADQREGSEA